jgi:hypothetical protein
MEANRIILDMKYARIIEIISQRLNVTCEEAMDIFYNSPTFGLIDKGVADLHCRSDRYLADEIINENHNNGYQQNQTLHH